MAVERKKQDIEVKNVMLWDIQKFYRDEYQVGKYAVKLIEERFHVQLNDDEAGFIALHIVNAQLDMHTKSVKEITKVMQDASEIVRYDEVGIPLYIREGLLSSYPDHRALCHWHEDIEWVQIRSGQMNYYINGKESF